MRVECPVAIGRNAAIAQNDTYVSNQSQLSPLYLFIDLHVPGSSACNDFGDRIFGPAGLFASR